MDINKIRFTPKSNAFADVYSKATGVPFIGEMMAAAAGNGQSNPFKNVVLNITQSDGDGSGHSVLTFNSDIIGKVGFTLFYGENKFYLYTGSFTPLVSIKYNTLYYDSGYEGITVFPNGGTYEVFIKDTEETYSGKWTLNDATVNCENTEFPSVEDIQIEETEDGWVGRITFDRDIRTYGDFYFGVINRTLDVGGFYLESNLWETTEFEYLGNNTFQISNISVETPQSGEFEDFTVDMRIGKFEQCPTEVAGITGTVTTLPNAPTVWYVAYGDKDGTVETSRGTGELTGVTEKIDEYGKLQEGILLTNNNYPQLVGQHIWFSEDAAVDDGDVWPIYIKYEGQFVPYDNLYGKFSSEEPEAPAQDVR